VPVLLTRFRKPSSVFQIFIYIPSVIPDHEKAT